MVREAVRAADRSSGPDVRPYPRRPQADSRILRLDVEGRGRSLRGRQAEQEAYRQNQRPRDVLQGVEQVRVRRQVEGREEGRPRAVRPAGRQLLPRRGGWRRVPAQRPAVLDEAGLRPRRSPGRTASAVVVAYPAVGRQRRLAVRDVRSPPQAQRAVARVAHQTGCGGIEVLELDDEFLDDADRRVMRDHHRREQGCGRRHQGSTPRSLGERF